MSFPSFLSQFIVYSNRREQPESSQIHVESLATAIVTLQSLQVVLYHVRFRANHWSVRCTTLPMPLAALAVAVMLRFPCPYWLVAIFFAAGQADTMAAYSLRDADRQSVRRFAKRALSFAYLNLALFIHGEGATTSNLRRKEVFSLVLGFVVVLQDLKISSRAMTPRSEICKVAAVHVRFPARRRRSPYTEYDDWVQHRRSVVAVGSLESYRSAVSGCTTLEDICASHYSPCSSRMQDACLYSARFLQLLQRYGNEYDRPQVLQRSSANHVRNQEWFVWQNCSN